MSMASCREDKRKVEKAVKHLLDNLSQPTPWAKEVMGIEEDDSLVKHTNAFGPADKHKAAQTLLDKRKLSQYGACAEKLPTPSTGSINVVFTAYGCYDPRVTGVYPYILVNAATHAAKPASGRFYY